MTSNRIECITGIKGLACFAFFLHHSILTLVPAAYYGGTESSTISWVLSSTPVGVFINGNFCVFLFMTISAFLTANSVLKSTPDNFREKVGTICIKRYFRLMLPILSYGCTRYLLVELFNRFDYPLPIGQYESLWFVIRHAMYDTFATIDSSITVPLWMMSLLFKNTYLVLLLVLPDRRSSGKHWIIWYALVFAFVVFSSERWKPYYLTAVMGTLLADMMPSLEPFVRKDTRWISKGLILLGLFLGSVPTPAVPSPMICYHFVSIYPEHPEFCHCIGAFLLLLGILGEYLLFQKMPHKKILIPFLQTRPIKYLGKISFSVFLVHQELINVLLPCVLDFFTIRVALSNRLAVCATLVVLTVIVISVSTAFYYGIENRMNRICAKIRV